MILIDLNNKSIRGECKAKDFKKDIAALKEIMVHPSISEQA